MTETYLFSPPTHLGDAQPLIVVAVEAKLNLLGFIGVEVERLVTKGLAAGLDLALVFPVIVSFVHVQLAGPLISLVERDLHADNVLGLLERVGDAASISLTRPARVCLATAVSSVIACTPLGHSRHHRHHVCRTRWRQRQPRSSCPHRRVLQWGAVCDGHVRAGEFKVTILSHRVFTRKVRSVMLGS